MAPVPANKSSILPPSTSPLVIDQRTEKIASRTLSPVGRMALPRATFRRLPGRRLKVPRGRAIRPTGERVREAIFSVLWSISRGAVEGGKILDLFAGTGAMGLEALSRGYESCLFVESDRQVARVLQSNLG